MPFDSLVWVVSIGLASARVTVLAVSDTITTGLRERIYLRWPPQDNPRMGFEYQQMDRQGEYLPMSATRDWSMFGELLSCSRCVSVWVTGALYLLTANQAGLRGSVAQHIVWLLAAMWVSAWGASKI